MRRFRGTGKITAADFKAFVKWVGRTKSGKAITIKLFNAINMGAMEWAYADKGEVVNEVVFTGTYTQNEIDAGSTIEPFEILMEDGLSAGESEILLGAGKLYINDNAVGLSRGGGKFARGAEIREITADNDRGTVKDRVVIDATKPTLSINAMELLTRLTELYPALEEVDAEEIEIASIGNVSMKSTAEKEIQLNVFPEGCTLSATVTGGEDLTASISGSVLTLETAGATVGDAYTVTVSATKAGYTAAAEALTVTVIA